MKLILFENACLSGEEEEYLLKRKEYPLITKNNCNIFIIFDAVIHQNTSSENVSNALESETYELRRSLLT